MRGAKNTKKSTPRVRVQGGVWVVIVLGVVASVYWYSAYNVTRSAAPADNPHGWMWNGYQLPGSSDGIGLGWTSMNCLNDFDNDNLLEYQCDATKPYGLNVSLTSTLDGSGDYLQGCGWSAGYGWVCFNGGAGSTYQCDTSLDSPDGVCADLDGSGVAIVAGPYTGVYRLDSPTYSGSWPSGTWAALTGAANDTKRGLILSQWLGTNDTTKSKGYIGFPFHNTNVTLRTSTAAEDVFAGCFGCKKYCSIATTKECTIDANCLPGEGTCSLGKCAACLNTSTEIGDCSGAGTQACNLDTDCPGTEYCTRGADNPNPNVLAWNCSNCTVADIGGRCSVNREHNTCVESSCADHTSIPGVIVNQYETGKFEMCGWGWHSYTESSVNKGLGWVAFNSDQINTTAYIDVGEGSILSGGNIYSPAPPPEGNYNAAFIIEASGDITNWYSENFLRFSQGMELPGFLREVGTGTGVYKNVLGGLDYTGLTLDAKPGAAVVNKFGSTLVLAASTDPSLTSLYPFDVPLADTVHVFTGGANFSLAENDSACPNAGNVICVNKATGEGSGAGIIVVNGDLAINKDIVYESGSGVTKLKQLPSLVWIVKGDVTIHPTVQNIAGTFIVLGDGTPTKCPELTEGATGCGRFSTGENPLQSPVQLTMHGSVLAKQFQFQRRYSTSGAPSELFNPAGRLQANTPSGLKDFAKSVPRYTSQ